MRTLLLCLALLFCASFTLAQAPDVIYVSQQAGDDTRPGTSWGLCVKTINRGIARAQEHSRHEIWVAKGTYTECVGINGYYIQLFGGFEVGMALRDQRDWVNNVTTIVGRYDDSNPFNNCPCVTITYASQSIVDGFVIKMGGGTPGPRIGGGLYIVESDFVKVWNNVITDNHAERGGGLYVQDCDNFWLKLNSITQNYGNTIGGGLYAVRSNFGPEYGNEMTPKIERNTIAGNFGGQRGGGCLFEDNCTGYFWQNTVGPDNNAVKGGGMAFYINSSLLVHQNTVNANGAGERGGGIYVENSGPNILLNTISDNTIGNTGRGAGIAVKTCSPRIERNRIKSNCCPGGPDGGEGGGIALEGASCEIIENIIDYNKVRTAGGGLAFFDHSSANLVNNTIAWNEAYFNYGGDPATCIGVGGGMALYEGSAATLRNNVFYENWAANCVDIYCDYTASVNSDYNDYYCNRSDGCGGMNNECNWTMGEHDLYADPDFIDGDYHQGPDSQVIDKGDNTASGVPGVDYPDGDPRKLDGDGNGSVTVDMGADEYWAAVTRWDQVKGAEEGRPVNIIGYATACYTNFLYIEESSRLMGIRVDEPAHGIGVSAPVRAYGKIRTNANSERYIDAFLAENLGGDGKALEPFAMNNKSIGGGTLGLQTGVWSWNNSDKQPPWAQAGGTNNIGLLVKVWGKVTWVNRDTAHPENEYFYIDDGSMRFDGTMHMPAPNAYQPNIGVRVVLEGAALPLAIHQDAFLTLIGISSCTKFDSDPVRLMRMRDQYAYIPWL